MQQIGAKVMFIEVSNEDEAFLTKHYHTTVQYSADYVGMNNKMSVCEIEPFSFTETHQNIPQLA